MRPRLKGAGPVSVEPKELRKGAPSRVVIAATSCRGTRSAMLPQRPMPFGRRALRCSSSIMRANMPGIRASQPILSCSMSPAMAAGSKPSITTTLAPCMRAARVLSAAPMWNSGVQATKLRSG
jgi:hypothetical protein